jgi:hypothetical protein
MLLALTVDCLDDHEADYLPNFSLPQSIATPLKIRMKSSENRMICKDSPIRNDGIVRLNG